MAITIEETPVKETKQTIVGTPVDDNQPLLLPQDQFNEKLISNVRPPDWQNPTPAPMYNLVVIGGGSAGLVAAVGAAGLGAKVAVIERDFIGGDCLNAGCVPSKTVIRSAKVLGELAKAAEFGVHVPDGTTVDFGAIMARMRRVRAEISDHDSAYRFKDLGIDLFLGSGKFTTPNTVDVEGATLTFKKAVIATGGRPMHLPIPGLADVGYLTNLTVFQLTERPQRLAVIGAGPIGSELAQSFRRFGSDVTIFDIVPRLLGREDAQAADVMRDVFEKEGIQLALGAKTEKIEQTAEGKTIHYELDGIKHQTTVDEILVAAGRQPNLETLNLEAAGVDYHAKGVTVSDTLQTSNPNIYAAGDVAFKYQFTHTADATARIVLQNALFPGPNKSVKDLIVPWTTYTDPEVA
ncbi:MAG: FAD-dependent oxidoreductase, partial [Chloroflexota bacterium]